MSRNGNHGSNGFWSENNRVSNWCKYHWQYNETSVSRANQFKRMNFSYVFENESLRHKNSSLSSKTNRESMTSTDTHVGIIERTFEDFYFQFSNRIPQYWQYKPWQYFSRKACHFEPKKKVQRQTGSCSNTWKGCDCLNRLARDTEFRFSSKRCRIDLFTVYFDT